jgi:phytoene dehydrogenase-like protein
MNDKTIIIIGAGMAGLSAGCYAQMNGYQSEIYEMHNLPGGLCTSWKRKGYTIDGCIHWLVGSSPKSPFYRYWQEVGVAQDRQFIDFDEYARFEGSDGRTLILYADPDRLEKHMIELSPEDEPVIKEFTEGVRFCLKFNPPSETAPALKRLAQTIRYMLVVVPGMKKIRTYMNTTIQAFADCLKSPLLKQAFLDMWFPEFGLFFMMFTFAYLKQRNAGYPIGGSLPMAKAVEQRYLDLGGVIHYNSRVAEILTEGGKATGIRLEDGRQVRGDIVISAADGHATIFDMLDGKYLDDTIRGYYDTYPLFPPLIFVGLGVKRTFEDLPKTVSGFSFPLKTPVEIGEKVRQRLPVHVFHHDPTLAPEGKTSIVVMLNSNYQYWKKLYEDEEAYEAKKKEIGLTIVEGLEQRFPGIKNQVEMIDVATPITFEHYTGNWQGSFEGFLITPQNAMLRMKNTLPGLENFYMAGQWVMPGGGLPTAVQSARDTLKQICKADGKKFTTCVA